MKRACLLGFLLVLTFILPACGAASTPTPPTAIKFQMGWTNDYSSSGYYAAEKNGHYGEQNLSVTLIPGGFGSSGYIEPIPQLLNGTADFTQTNLPALLEARAAGQPI